MKIAVRIDTTAALKAGKNCAGVRVLDIDPAMLTQEERDMLATKCHTNSSASEFRNVAADLYLIYSPGPTTLIDATAEDLRRILTKSLADFAADKAKSEAQRAKEAAEKSAEDARQASAPVTELIEYDRYKTRSPWGIGHALLYPDTYPLTAARKAEAETECATRNAKLAAEAEAVAGRDAEAKARIEAARAEAKTKLEAWCRSHGSDLANARLEAGYDCWFSEARKNYFATVLAVFGGQDIGEMDEYEAAGEDRKCPTLVELNALAAAREIVRTLGDPNVVAKVSLIRATYTPKVGLEDDDDGDDGDDGEIIRTELAVKLTIFGQWSEAFYFLIAE